MSTNAETLTNKMSEFKLLIDEHGPDIICVSEVLPKSYSRKISAEEFKIKDYSLQ